MSHLNRSKLYLGLFLVINMFTCAIIANDLYHVSHPRKELHIDEFTTIFETVKDQIARQQEIDFYTNVPDLEGSALYFQSQFVLTPTVLSRETNQNKLALLVINPKLPVDYFVNSTKKDTLFLKATPTFTVLLIQKMP